MYSFIFLLNEEKNLPELKKLLGTLEGKVVKELPVSKKTLAYPIQKQESATMYEWELDINGSKVEELKKKLSFNPLVLRYLLLKQD